MTEEAMAWPTCIGWVSNDDPGEDNLLGGMGGWFGYVPDSKLKEEAGHRWKDYLDCFKVEAWGTLESLREQIIANDVWCSGEQHQYTEGRCPKFSDGTVGRYSFRAWGDLMAAVWSTKYNQNYGYMDFYMDTPRKPT